MTHAIVARYTEGRGATAETFAVHADGSISRPAINMGPSGRWRITGAGTASGCPLFHSFPALMRAAAAGELPAGPLHLFDLDCNTPRQHGAPAAFRLEPGADLELVERLDAERRERERAARESARLEALERCKRRKVAWRSPDGGITLYRAKGGQFALVDGDAVQEELPLHAAAAALGAAIIDSVA